MRGWLDGWTVGGGMDGQQRRGEGELQRRVEGDEVTHMLV